MKKIKPIPVIIDFEFTSLDNTFITDNEIVQMKVMNTITLRTRCEAFSSKKKLCAHSFLHHSQWRFYGAKFSKERFEMVLNSIGIETDKTPVVLYGYGVNQDMLMLKKYGITVNIIDLREMIQLSKYEFRMATEGSGLEDAHVICTGRHPNLKNHGGTEELFVIKNIYDKAIRVRKNQFFTVMPHGHCAGMPLTKYVDSYRKQADGYRWNNNDTLSASLTEVIENQVTEQHDHYRDEDDF